MVVATLANAPYCARRVLRAIRTSLPISACLAALWLGAASVRGDPTSEEPQVWRIGATTTVTEVTTGLPFPARVDTGATSCSIHCEAIKIKDAAAEPKDNIGKPVRILLMDADGAEHWVKTKIVQHVRVRTSEREDERYKVPLKLRWQDVEKKVLVTLNDRERMKYPMLLGRNFLRGDFLVDVNLEGSE
jgi:hypothetical protein